MRDEDELASHGEHEPETDHDVREDDDHDSAQDGDADDEIDDPELDEDFLTGDGTADGEALVTCPYCGEAIEIALDAGSGARQDYVEDCEVCCQPWRVSVQYHADGSADVQVTALDE